MTRPTLRQHAEVVILDDSDEEDDGDTVCFAMSRFDQDSVQLTLPTPYPAAAALPSPTSTVQSTTIVQVVETDSTLQI